MTRDELITALFREGKSQRHIAGMIGLSQPGTRKHLLRLGLITANRNSQSWDIPPPADPQAERRDVPADHSPRTLLVNPSIDATAQHQTAPQGFSGPSPDNLKRETLVNAGFAALSMGPGEHDALRQTFINVNSVHPDNLEAPLVVKLSVQLRAELETIGYEMTTRRGTSLTDVHKWGQRIVSLAQMIPDER